MPDEREQAIQELVSEWMQRARSDLLLAQMIEEERIGLLLNLCQRAGFETTEAIADAATLTRYAVSKRYHGEDEPVTRQEAGEAADLAVRVLTWVESLIEEEP